MIFNSWTNRIISQLRTLTKWVWNNKISNLKTDYKKIKYGEIEDRPIYGEATLEQTKELIDEEINNSEDLKNLSKKIQPLEKEITLFHAKVVNEIIENSKTNIDFLGFHGQTIFHNAKEKISKQLGTANYFQNLQIKQ